MGKFKIIKKHDSKDKKSRGDIPLKKWKGRQFLITQNDTSLSSSTAKYLKNMKTFRFMVACREVAPRTHHIHDHFFVQYKDSISISNAGVKYAHIDHPRGTVEDNIAYIYKIKQPYLRGLIYLKYGEPTFFSGLKVKDVINMTNEDIKELPAGLYKTAKEIKGDYCTVVKASEMLKNVKIFYLWGDTHTLKSKHAILFIEKCCGDECEQVSYDNGYWNGSRGLCKTAFYDEFRDTAMPLNIFLQFIDYNSQPMNIKHGSSRNIYERIVITSSQNPATLYSKDTGPNESSGQWLRRMKIFHFYYDNELEEYCHVQENYLYDIKERPAALISKSKGIVYKHLNGEILKDHEVDAYISKHKEEPFKLFPDVDKSDQDKEKDEVEEQINTTNKLNKKKKEKLVFSQQELRLRVYNELKKPLDKLPKTDEELLNKITPNDDIEDSDIELND